MPICSTNVQWEDRGTACSCCLLTERIRNEPRRLVNAGSTARSGDCPTGVSVPATGGQALHSGATNALHHHAMNSSATNCCRIRRTAIWCRNAIGYSRLLLSRCNCCAVRFRSKRQILGKLLLYVLLRVCVLFALVLTPLTARVCSVVVALLTSDCRQLTSRSHQPDPSIGPSMTHNTPANPPAAASTHSVGNGWPTPRATASWQTPSSAAPPAYSTPSAAMAHSSIQSTPRHESQFPQIDAMLSQLSSAHVQSADEILKQRNQRLDPTLDRLDRAIGRANSDVEQRARSTIRQQSPNRIRT